MTPPQHRERPLYRITMNPDIHRRGTERADELGLPFSRYIEQLVRRDLIRAQMPGGGGGLPGYIDALAESEEYFENVQPQLDQIIAQHGAETRAEIEAQRPKRTSIKSAPKPVIQRDATKKEPKRK